MQILKGLEGILSLFDDPANDALYEPHEVGQFFDELLLAQKKVKGPRFIGGLDNLIRAARWARKLKLGIYFGGV